MAAPAEGVQLSQIGQIAVTITDLDRAVAFYRDTLGMKFLFRAPNLAFFDCGGVRLMIGPPEGIAPSGNSVIYYRVDDIERTCGILSGRGVEFEGNAHIVAKMPDHDLWMAFFRDPDRNLLALMSEVPRR